MALEPLISVINLKKYFPVYAGLISKLTGYVKAVDGVSFSILPGEIFGLVGESGCGKSTTGKTVLKLLNPTEGKVYFRGRDVFAMNKNELCSLRTEMQIIYQDPFSSLDPRMMIGEAVGEALEEHGIARGRAKKERVEYMLEVCGLDPHHFYRYPHEFSAGQRQKVCIARALALNPRFIAADEPISFLDVSIQAQLINLLKKIQEEFGLTFLFISHDLRVVQHLSDKVAVMYLGKIVETGSSSIIYRDPLHPYTRALLSAVPAADPTLKKKERIILKGDVPSPVDPPRGCRFHTRCQYSQDICKEEIPVLKKTAEGHFTACHLIKSGAK
ncbi:MAG: peptide ABC transporter substrate-binding protein [Firmicutes bacterium HGW-Firmicutes-13]|nr:MAG: peptide ABC transporter substrate-binding protein [Firmicutes bacterium HGW-Firmicutes-13]